MVENNIWDSLFSQCWNLFCCRTITGTYANKAVGLESSLQTFSVLTWIYQENCKWNLKERLGRGKDLMVFGISLDSDSLSFGRDLDFASTPIRLNHDLIFAHPGLDSSQFWLQLCAQVSQLNHELLLEIKKWNFISHISLANFDFENLQMQINTNALDMDFYLNLCYQFTKFNVSIFHTWTWLTFIATVPSVWIPYKGHFHQHQTNTWLQETCPGLHHFRMDQTAPHSSMFSRSYPDLYF